MSSATAVAPVAVPGPDLTIVQAAEVRARLLEQLPLLAEDPRLDLRSVTEFDSSGLQLLVALRHSLAAQGHTLQLLAPSAIVRDALDTVGLTEQFPVVAG
jgi:anti-anti-sigma factor